MSVIVKDGVCVVEYNSKCGMVRRVFRGVDEDVAEVLERIISNTKVKYRPIDVDLELDIVKLSYDKFTIIVSPSANINNVIDLIPMICKLSDNFDFDVIEFMKDDVRIRFLPYGITVSFDEWVEFTKEVLDVLLRHDIGIISLPIGSFPVSSDDLKEAFSLLSDIESVIGVD